MFLQFFLISSSVLWTSSFNFPCAMAKSLVVDDRDTSVVYTPGGAWAPLSEAPELTGTRVVGASATVKFQGTGISWLGAGSQEGKVDLRLDGRIYTVNLRPKAEDSSQNILWSETGLAEGIEHTVQIVNSLGAQVAVDNFVIEQPDADKVGSAKNTDQGNGSSSSGIKPGLLAGLCIAGLVGGLLTVLVVVFVYRRYFRKKSEDPRDSSMREAPKDPRQSMTSSSSSSVLPSDTHYAPSSQYYPSSLIIAPSGHHFAPTETTFDRLDLVEEGDVVPELGRGGNSRPPAATRRPWGHPLTGIKGSQPMSRRTSMGGMSAGLARYFGRNPPALSVAPSVTERTAGSVVSPITPMTGYTISSFYAPSTMPSFTIAPGSVKGDREP